MGLTGVTQTAGVRSVSRLLSWSDGVWSSGMAKGKNVGLALITVRPPTRGAGYIMPVASEKERERRFRVYKETPGFRTGPFASCVMEMMELRL